MSWLLILIILLIFLFIINESLVSIKELNLSFLRDDSWYPLEGQFNMIPMIVGSLYVTLGAILFAFPVGLFAALFACFYCPLILQSVYVRAIELYTGIPSVIFGFWGLMKLVPVINEINPPGQSLLAGIIILTLMIFPIFTLNLISNFKMNTQEHYKVSMSLGFKRSTYIWFILIPNLKYQILGSVTLATGRAIGETMAVLMVCGNIVKIPSSVFDPMRTLTANIALEMSYATGTHRSSLFFSGFILLVLIVLLFFVLEILKRSFKWRS